MDNNSVDFSSTNYERVENILKNTAAGPLTAVVVTAAAFAGRRVMRGGSLTSVASALKTSADKSTVIGRNFVKQSSQTSGLSSTNNFQPTNLETETLSYSRYRSNHRFSIINEPAVQQDILTSPESYPTHTETDPSITNAIADAIEAHPLLPAEMAKPVDQSSLFAKLMSSPLMQSVAVDTFAKDYFTEIFSKKMADQKKESPEAETSESDEIRDNYSNLTVHTEENSSLIENTGLAERAARLHMSEQTRILIKISKRFDEIFSMFPDFTDADSKLTQKFEEFNQKTRQIFENAYEFVSSTKSANTKSQSTQESVNDLKMEAEKTDSADQTEETSKAELVLYQTLSKDKEFLKSFNGRKILETVAKTIAAAVIYHYIEKGIGNNEVSQDELKDFFSKISKKMLSYYDKIDQLCSKVEEKAALDNSLMHAKIDGIAEFSEEEKKQAHAFADALHSTLLVSLGSVQNNIHVKEEKLIAMDEKTQSSLAGDLKNILANSTISTVDDISDSIIDNQMRISKFLTPLLKIQAKLFGDSLSAIYSNQTRTNVTVEEFKELQNAYFEEFQGLSSSSSIEQTSSYNMLKKELAARGLASVVLKFLPQLKVLETGKDLAVNVVKSQDVLLKEPFKRASAHKFMELKKVYQEQKAVPEYALASYETYMRKLSSELDARQAAKAELNKLKEIEAVKSKASESQAIQPSLLKRVGSSMMQWIRPN